MEPRYRSCSIHWMVLVTPKADNAKTETEANDMAKVPYRAVVGMLSYIMGHTKPDIAYALNVLSRYCNNPG